MVSKSLSAPVDLMGDEAPEPVMRDVDPEEKDERQPTGLKGSPSGLLREENERRKTLETIRQKKMSTFEERREERLSRLSQGKAAAQKAKKPSKPEEIAEKPKGKGEKAAEQAAAPVADDTHQSIQRMSIGVRPSTTRVPRTSRVASIIGRRASLGTEDGKKGPRYANTYRMESKNPFKAWQVYKILRDLLERDIESNEPYEPLHAAKRCADLAKDIRTAIKQQAYDRYKFCVKVDIGQKLDQGVCSMARFMWDIERDDFAFYSCQNIHYFVIATVFAFYYD